ncbi:KRAB [Mytilus coruscus]|uniref:KRAB n=1 Tax=Mytilus coruscus TaxID=42192 RepID=A0A6J8A5W3_MYTCO|nr:KRAB [Mytilus coruscus]
MSVRDVIGPHGKLSLVLELDHTRSLSRDNKEVNLQSGKKIIQTSKQPNQESSGQSFITYKHKCANSEKNQIKKEEINWPEGVVDLMEEHISSSEFAEGVVDLMEEHKGVDALMEEHNYFSTNKHTTKRFLLMKSQDKNSEHEFQKSVISRPMKRQTFIEGEHYIMSKNMRFVCMLCNQHFRKMLSFEHHARDTHYMYSCTVYHAVFTEKNQLLNHSRHCVYVRDNIFCKSLSDHDSWNSASKRVRDNASKRVTDHDLEDLAKSSPKKRKSLRPNRYRGKKDGQQYEQLSVNKGLDYHIKKREFVKCSQCESLFVSKGHLEAHIKSEHRKFICSVCGASFKKRSVFQKHNRSCVLP